MMGREDDMCTGKDGPASIVLNEVDARQGVTGHNVRYVLGVGLAASIIALAVVFFFFF
jgi:hypothetical protein